MVLSTTTFVDSVQSNRMLIREWTRINKLVLSTTTFVDSVQSNRMLIREWTRIDKLCRPKQEKQQIIRWDTSSHINKFVDQQDGSNNQIVVSVPTSTSGVVPNRQNAARQLYQKTARRAAIWPFFGPQGAWGQFFSEYRQVGYPERRNDMP